MTDDEARITKQAQSPNVRRASISGFVFLSSFVLSLESFRWQPWDSRLGWGRLRILVENLWDSSTRLGCLEVSFDVFFDHQFRQVGNHFPCDALDNFPAQFLDDTVGNTFDNLFGNHGGNRGCF